MLPEQKYPGDSRVPALRRSPLGPGRCRSCQAPAPAAVPGSPGWIQSKGLGCQRSPGQLRRRPAFLRPRFARRGPVHCRCFILLVGGWVVASSRARIRGIVRCAGDGGWRLAHTGVAQIRTVFSAGVGWHGLVLCSIYRRKDQNAIDPLPGGVTFAGVFTRILGLRRAGHNDREH